MPSHQQLLIHQASFLLDRLDSSITLLPLAPPADPSTPAELLVMVEDYLGDPDPATALKRRQSIATLRRENRKRTRLDLSIGPAPLESTMSVVSDLDTRLSRCSLLDESVEMVGEVSESTIGAVPYGVTPDASFLEAFPPVPDTLKYCVVCTRALYELSAGLARSPGFSQFVCWECTGVYEEKVGWVGAGAGTLSASQAPAPAPTAWSWLTQKLRFRWRLRGLV